MEVYRGICVYICYTREYWVYWSIWGYMGVYRSILGVYRGIWEYIGVY